MFALIWGAVRTRRAQVLTVLILTALAAAVAAAGPWYAVASSNRAAAADVAAAPAEQRTISVRQIADTQGQPRTVLQQFAAKAQGLLPLPATAPVGGMVMPMTVANGNSTSQIGVAYRDDFCAHVRLDGDCPSRSNEIAISAKAAQQLGVGIGGTTSLRASPTTEPIRLKVVGFYLPADPTGLYWSNSLYRAEGTALDPVFTPLQTFELRELWEPTVSFDVQVPDALIRGGGDLATALRAADVRMGAAELRLVNPIGVLLAVIARDRAEIRTGVLVAMIQILVLAWFAIGLAGRYTGRDRRGDAALLKLRGSARGGMLRLAWGQHVVPLLAGAVVGLPLGWLVARLLAGPLTDGRGTALLLSVVAVAAVLVGGLLVLAVVEGLVLRQPVAVLLRQVGTARGDWRSGVVDLLLLAVAVAAVYQARSSAAGSGLALAAPALVGLAVALLLARLLGRLADRGGGAAVRTGHLRAGLTAVQVSRQPGSDRVFALVVVAVAMFATAVGGWYGEDTARTDRSTAELGADRVLTVQVANRTGLVDAVRTADPGGTQAMAVVVDRAANPPVLAVDSARLAAVARWRPEYGPLGALPSGDLGPAPLPAVTGDRLGVRLTHDGKKAAVLNVVLLNEKSGAPVKVRFGRLGPGDQTLTAPVPGCADGCRILRWEVTSPPTAEGLAFPAPDGTAVTIRALTQQNPSAEILGGAALGDITRWRSGTEGAAMDVDARDGVLRMNVDANLTAQPMVGSAVWAVDTALPLPVVLSGPKASAWQFGESNVSSFGGSPIPVRVAGTAAALPVLGRAGVLVDLEATRRIIGDANPPAEYQVWLAPGAGRAVVDRLVAAGLRVSGDESVSSRSAQLAEQAPATVIRFSLVCGVVGLLLAAAAIGVAGAVDRRTRLGQLTALRVQGLPVRTTVATAYAGPAALIGTGLIGGLLAAAVAGPLARVSIPDFTDGWNVLAAPGALGRNPFLFAGLAALVVLGLVGWLSVLPLVRRLRRAGKAGR
ncbi:ABC transporter permease [Actinoplanes sp. TBRC 11911]|uniref:FtsX-like permease family protein n=1 Tax=Actinoplanes sp. TBRC 11911 TaxID=2729386 RepID=UPI00145C9B98|nr:FtsX-like permease family protein [Actinoplanes sp. TBRC 11911]NMO51184.1 ABC transporter permease [Actinoplanes sp. TBRC 11911]